MTYLLLFKWKTVVSRTKSPCAKKAELQLYISGIVLDKTSNCHRDKWDANAYRYHTPGNKDLVVNKLAINKLE